MNQLIHDRGIEAFADRFFVWPHEQQDATFYRNCAMKELWEDCYYVSSERSESDANLNRSIIDNLEKAYGLNPMLPIPYDNYCEVCHLDGRSPIIPSTAVSMNDGYKPGYRKGMVKETIDRLTIIIPGSYQRHLGFNDDDWPITIWCDESTDSPVWRLTIFELEKEIGKPKLEGNQYDYYEEFDIEGGNGVLALQQCQEDGDDFYMVICQIASGTSLHLITVSYKKQKEFDQIRSLLLLICTKLESNILESIGTAISSFLNNDTNSVSLLNPLAHTHDETRYRVSGAYPVLDDISGTAFTLLAISHVCKS